MSQTLITDYLNRDTSISSQFSNLNLQDRSSPFIFGINSKLLPQNKQIPEPETVLFTHPDISPVYFPSVDQYGFYATKEIEAGTCILIEEGFVGESNTSIAKFLFHNKDIASRLYPRNHRPDLWSSFKECERKAAHNVWEWSPEKNAKNKIVFLPYTSMFNHSCTPNVDASQYSHWSQTHFRMSEGFAIYSTSFIPAGEELTISYGESVGHVKSSVFSWECNCGLSHEERLDNYNKSLRTVRECFSEDEMYIMSHILE